jgi:hypothetical protein
MQSDSSSSELFRLLAVPHHAPAASAASWSLGRLEGRHGAAPVGVPLPLRGRPVVRLPVLVHQVHPDHRRIPMCVRDVARIAPEAVRVLERGKGGVHAVHHHHTGMHVPHTSLALGYCCHVDELQSDSPSWWHLAPFPIAPPPPPPPPSHALSSIHNLRPPACLIRPRMQSTRSTGPCGRN